jgi:uncharacterized protein (TIGR02246 family)
MRKVNLIVLAVVAIYLLTAPLALGQGGNPPASTKESGATSGHGQTAVEQTSKSIEQQIAALSDQAVHAYLKGDTGFIEKHYADDATIIHSDGKLSTKAQEIENFKSGALKYESIDVHDRKIRVYGNTAVVVALSSTKGTLGGKPFSGDFRSTRIWVKEHGNWKIVEFQSTRETPSQ